MIKIEKAQVFNFEGAFRGLRNPLESWDKSDSNFKINRIGEKDLALAKRMIKGGTDESKFLRQIMVSMDITAPLFFWKEMDTYKVSTVANSTSTMHKLTSTPITKECFSFDNLEETDTKLLLDIIDTCEFYRRLFVNTQDKKYWYSLIEILPEAWLQKRTWTANYQVLRNIYNRRVHHKLDEWKVFCKAIETLPYATELIIE